MFAGQLLVTGEGRPVGRLRGRLVEQLLINPRQPELGGGHLGAERGVIFLLGEELAVEGQRRVQ